MKYLIILFTLTACTITEPIQPVAQKPTPEDPEPVEIKYERPEWLEIDTTKTRWIFTRPSHAAHGGFIGLYLDGHIVSLWCPVDSTRLTYRAYVPICDDMELVVTVKHVEVWREWLIVQNENGE